MKKQKKHIAIILLLTFLFYSSAQAFLLYHCECENDFPQIETKECCCVNEITSDTVKDNCHSIGYSLNNEIVDPEIQKCISCSFSCVQQELFNDGIPDAFYKSTFDQQIQLVSKTNCNAEIDNNRDLQLKIKPQNSNQDFIPIKFGKSLLIKINSLKIPAHII